MINFTSLVEPPPDYTPVLQFAQEQRLHALTRFVLITAVIINCVTWKKGFSIDEHEMK